MSEWVCATKEINKKKNLKRKGIFSLSDGSVMMNHELLFSVKSIDKKFMWNQEVVHHSHTKPHNFFYIKLEIFNENIKSVNKRE